MHPDLWNRPGTAVAAWTMAVLVLTAVLGPGSSAFAQPLEQPEGEVRTCEAFANRLYKRERASLLPVTIEWERGLRVDPFAGTVGRQKVATVLHGLASYTGEAGRGESRFVCLLAGPSRALFFHLLPLHLSGDADREDPLRACGGGEGNVAACLAQRLAQAEQALDAAVAAGRASMQRLEQGSGRSGLTAAFDAAQAAWLTWRDSTCRLESLAADPSTAAASFDQACRVRTATERARTLAP